MWGGGGVGKYLKPSGEVVLAWPYKDCVLEGGQMRESDRRNEVFFNQTLARDEITQLLSPKVLTAAVRHTAEGKQTKVQLNRDAEFNQKRGLPTDTITDNLLIKGNNLIALHSLKSQFAGKVKLIYIDPPYNTGGDSFLYNDRFNHSTWLTFMKNRLEVARDLLRDDGVIFVQCDDNEQAYLKVLMDEIFSVSNFVANVVWEKKYSPQNNSKWLSDSHDHILVHAKDKQVWRPNLLPRTESMDARYKNLDDDPRGNWKISGLDAMGDTHNIYPITTPSGRVVYPPKGRCWAFNKSRFEEMVADNRIWFGKTGNNVPAVKRFRTDVIDGAVPKTIWTRKEVGDNQESKREIKNLDLGDIFTTPKPERLIKRILHLATTPGDIVLDYHLGSGTTAAVAHKMGRQYIGIEQMDYIETVAIARMKKVIAGEQGGISKSVDWNGGGNFVYLELKQHNQQFVDAIQAATTARMLSTIWQKMETEAFLDYNLDIEKQKEYADDFKALSLEQQKKFLLDILDKNQMYVNLSSLKDADRHCNAEEKRITADFYGLKK